MSWNTWLASMTKMENLSDTTLLEMRRRLKGMISTYQESLYMGGALGSHSSREICKCEEQLERVHKEMNNRGLYDFS
jgi:hypothetical protein